MMVNGLFQRFTLALLAMLLIAGLCVTAGAQSLVPPPSPPLAPEIDTGTLGGAIAMLACGAFLFMTRLRHRASEQKS